MRRPHEEALDITEPVRWILHDDLQGAEATQLPMRCAEKINPVLRVGEEVDQEIRRFLQVTDRLRVQLFHAELLAARPLPAVHGFRSHSAQRAGCLSLRKA